MTDTNHVPCDPREIGRQFVELLDKLRAGSRLAVKSPESQISSPGDDLFLMLDHEGVLVCVVRDEREFEIARCVRITEILAREIPGHLPPDLQIAMASRRMGEIMPKFQMVRP